MKILDFLQAENIPFQKLSLYKEAFTHASYANEAHHYNKDYERLEFMGDAVLQLSGWKIDCSKILMTSYLHK